MPDDSILDSIKKIVGYDLEYDVYDLDMVMHINSVFASLHQLGVGPDDGFEIEDNTQTWAEFLAKEPNPKAVNSVKSYVSLKVKLIFDPPATSFALTAMENVVKEFEWRLNVQAEERKWRLLHPDVPEGVLDND